MFSYIQTCSNFLINLLHYLSSEESYEISVFLVGKGYHRDEQVNISAPA